MKAMESIKKVLTVTASALLCVVLLCALCLPAMAIEQSSVPEKEWSGFEEAVPDGLRDKLPDGALDDSTSFGESVSKMSSASYLWQVVSELLGVELGGAAALLATVMAVLTVSAVMSAIGDGAHLSAVRYCTVGALISAVIYTQYTHLERLVEFFDGLEMLMGGMIPVTAGIWAMGGNVSTASVGSATFYVMLSVCHWLCSSTAVPVSGALTVLGFCDAMSGEVRTGRVMGAIRKIYNFLLNTVMTVLLFSLSAQSAIAASADTAAARAARLVSGTVIPVVGGSVGETFRTVAGGVAYLKNSFGIGGILLIALLTLPLLLSVLLTRCVFLISGGIADMLGCRNEARLLDNLAEVYGCLLGVLAGVSVMFVMAICVFMQTAIAVE